MKKIVAKLDIFDEKDKKKALQTVSSLSGIDSVSIDMKDRKLTVIGDVDPIHVVNKLRKFWHTVLLSIGPHKEPERKTEDNKKKEVREDEKKKEVVKEVYEKMDEKKKEVVKEVYEKMKEVIKKKEERKKDAEHNNNQDEYIHEVIKTYQNLLEMYSKILDLYSEY